MRSAYLAIGLVFAALSAAAQHRHPPQDQALHERFYSTWYMPDNPNVSCCNSADCYPTDIKYIGGDIYARRREDGKYILVPRQKVERNRDNPDGRNHPCAPPPQSSQGTGHLCSVSHWEAAYEVRTGKWENAPSAILLCGLRWADRSKLLARAEHARLLLRLCLLLRPSPSETTKASEGVMTPCLLGTKRSRSAQRSI